MSLREIIKQKIIYLDGGMGTMLLAKLGLHTVLIFGYLFGAWKIIRK